MTVTSLLLVSPSSSATLTLMHTEHLTLSKPPLCVIRSGVELNRLCMIQSAAGVSYSTVSDGWVTACQLPWWIATSWKTHLYVDRMAFSWVQSVRVQPGQTCPSTKVYWLKFSCFTWAILMWCTYCFLWCDPTFTFLAFGSSMFAVLNYRLIRIVNNQSHELRSSLFIWVLIISILLDRHIALGFWW